MTAAGQAGSVSSDAGSRQQSASSSEQIAQQAAGVEPASKKSIIDATFGLAVRQRTKVTTGLQADKLRESRSFQVCTCLPDCTGPHACTGACFGPTLQFCTA
jgi:NAD(P)H-hydrate repair Nnr-like enzyme with NAD(P)H-hydrate epimerase domain